MGEQRKGPPYIGPGLEAFAAALQTAADAYKTWERVYPKVHTCTLDVVKIVGEDRNGDAMPLFELCTKNAHQMATVAICAMATAQPRGDVG